MAADMDRPSRSGTTRCPRARRKSRRLARPGRSSRTPKTSSVKIRSHVNVLYVVLRLEALAVSAQSRVLDCRRACCVEGLRRLAMDDDHAEGAPAGHPIAEDVKDAVSVRRPRSRDSHRTGQNGFRPSCNGRRRRSHAEGPAYGSSSRCASLNEQGPRRVSAGQGPGSSVSTERARRDSNPQPSDP